MVRSCICDLVQQSTHVECCLHLSTRWAACLTPTGCCGQAARISKLWEDALLACIPGPICCRVASWLTMPGARPR